ncbi:MAG TPA: hypothetical protein VG982_02080 [Candidatus Paceibacterota bacterium]|nr:hypothetical protein [Candidatus Paceibacterota bacterium]
MKKFLILVFSFCLLSATHAFATEFDFNETGNTIHVTSGMNHAIVTLTHTGDVSETSSGLTIWTTKASDGSLTGKVFDSGSFTVQKGEVRTFTITGLVQNKTYYVHKAGDTKTFVFSTEFYSVGGVPTADGSSVSFTSQIPNDEKRSLYLFFSKTIIDPTVVSVDLLSFPKYFIQQYPTGSIMQSSGFTNHNYTQTTVPLLPDIEQGGWVYVYLAAKNNDGWEILTPGNLTQFGKEQKIVAAPLTFTSSDTTMTISGKIDCSVHLNCQQFKITLEYAPVPTPGDKNENKPFGTDLSAMPFGSTGSKQLTATVASDGTYSWKVPDLVPSGDYYFRQIITTPAGATDVQVGDFYNDSRGFIPPNTPAAQSDESKQSYHLLAPIPGLSVLFDPELCLKKLAGGMTPTKLCNYDDPSGVNGFLNYIFTILIGAAAVVLVIRLIIEGYIFATSDTPFKIAGAKAKFWEAFFGLLLALSAWIILNTINPKLVVNSVNISTVNVDITEVAKQFGAIFSGGDGRDPSYKGNLPTGTGVRGIRNKNYGNLLTPPQWQGQTGTDIYTDKNGVTYQYAVFSDPIMGVRALMVNLETQYTRPENSSSPHWKTLSQLFSYYSSTDTNHIYATTVSQNSKIPINVDVGLVKNGIVDKGVLYPILRSIFIVECGQKIDISDAQLDAAYQLAFP